MSDKEKYLLHPLVVNGLNYSMKTRKNGSQINIGHLTNGIIPGAETFWIDLQFEIEQTLKVKVIGMELRPSDFRRPEHKDTIHVIHSDSISNQEFARMIAHEEVEKLNRMHTLAH
ncbi:MAG: hypothetical protein A2831_03345 [Candidatus Yanofskybacteria bacterium RIFCSPHIGHO2_01_FULL_44_17]|uniref:Uncharacterized protein n=1 Tax=Candidatus Yanofskybacteria bacterium RIFCSPHIGHO2_01_FULL_44_17 TaxID=1802668 RepID=A0A1F8EXF2_9BACT|nr:MAG: hypothetical protein A2831_03345 [Candidatus Yanofskybacteria bacterium RIFCSPHIGHO2_01_FULL_44_17]